MRGKALFEAALHNAASVLVRANLVTVGHAGSIDELGVGSVGLGTLLIRLFWLVRGLESEQEGLDDMVAIWVGRQVKDVLRHLSSEHENLLMEGCRVLTQYFDKGLNGASSVQVHGHLNKLVETGFD